MTLAEREHPSPSVPLALSCGRAQWTCATLLSLRGPRGLVRCSLAGPHSPPPEVEVAQIDRRRRRRRRLCGFSAAFVLDLRARKRLWVAKQSAPLALVRSRRDYCERASERAPSRGAPGGPARRQKASSLASQATGATRWGPINLLSLDGARDKRPPLKSRRRTCAAHRSCPVSERREPISFAFGLPGCLAADGDRDVQA